MQTAVRGGGGRAAERFSVRVGPTRDLLADLKLDVVENESGISIVEHVLPPRALAAPPHRHTREDEFSCVLEGEITVWEEGRVRGAFGPGSLVEKRRDRFHTFWNGGDTTLRFLEIIAPGGFAHFFREVDALLPQSGAPTGEQIRQIQALNERYGLEMDWEAVPEIVSRYGLSLSL